MARKVSKLQLNPKPSGEIRQFDETNLARLGLISAQERIASSYTTWKTAYDVNGHDGELSCFSPAEVGGVPHGVDGDFVTALNTLYLEQGAPVDALVHTTAYQLIQRAGFEDNGASNERLAESLRRLRVAEYVIGRAWRRRGEEGNGWASVAFSYISQIRQSTPEHRDLSRGTTLSIQLADPVAESIRNQYIHPLDLEFQVTLKRPLTRALYRLLNARRYSEQDQLNPIAQFTVLVSDWARDCKLTEVITARIKRNLEEAHQELIRRQYLADVIFEGRGSKATIIYVYGDVGTAQQSVQVTPDSPLVQTLIEQQVARNVAVKLIKDYGEAHVYARLERFATLIASGYQPRQSGALLVDIIKDQEGKYGDGTGIVSVQKVATKPRQGTQQTASRNAPRHDSTDAEDAREEAEFRALPLEEQAARTVSALKMILRS
ncbi:replication initiator protein A [Deinococcus ruber]|uniref:Plasmid replication initiator protein n=1 Tax=Deinococcus ruber TaxID=1848197 RepID=A0A918C7E7_9DEIO|nr:replication initiator protein A [Deinococcus ruber]GGR10425.1 hypothetical protein GCM10008957_23860 [Deinococcus ruber]